MKKQLLALLALGLLLATGSAYAQSSSVAANVPFNFVAGNLQLPAGEYVIKAGSPSQAILSISGADSKKLVMSNLCESPNAPEQTKLVFHHYGDRYFLAQIWVAGDRSGSELPRSRQETEIARTQPRHDVVLAAQLR